MQPAAIRADPGDRLPARRRRQFGIVPNARLAWVLTAQAVTRHPALFLLVLLGWGTVRFLCLRSIEQAHLGLGGSTSGDLGPWHLAGLFALAAIADTGPIVVAAILMPPQHRLILGEPAPGAPMQAAIRTARLFAALLALSAAGASVLAGFLLLPRVLIGMLGQVSTLLSLILVLPLVILTFAALLRLSFGLPALSLALPCALAEGWDISRFQVTRAACTWMLATLPIAALLAVWVTLKPDPMGWTAIFVRPAMDVLAVSLTASLTGLFYRAYRLPAALRPDRRPSRNPMRRQEPASTGALPQTPLVR